MNFKMLSRNMDDILRSTNKDIHKVQRNFSSEEHPLKKTREYIRAINAAKLERVFAKPFLGSLDGHSDSISCLATHPNYLSSLLSASCDGEIRIWNIPNKKCIKTYQAHQGTVKGLVVHPVEDYFYSVGDDKLIKQWKFNINNYNNNYNYNNNDDDDEEEEEEEAMNTIIGKDILTSIDHHRNENKIVTSGQNISIYDVKKIEPIRIYYDNYTNISVKFNQSETDIIVSTGMDRGINLYDIRSPNIIRKTIMSMVSNNVSWNPMEPFLFTVANDDYNLYTFDMRNLKKPKVMHKNHIAAVLDVDYQGTGREFCSGSYDKTIRIFPYTSGFSREVYHTKRMQRVSRVKWSGDGKYIYSCSDDINIRIWRARANIQSYILKAREKQSINYNEALKKKYKHFPEVKKILNHRHIPKNIYNGAKELREIQTSMKRKENNKRIHSKEGKIKFKSEKSQKIIKEII